MARLSLLCFVAGVLASNEGASTCPESTTCPTAASRAPSLLQLHTSSAGVDAEQLADAKSVETDAEEEEEGSDREESEEEEEEEDEEKGDESAASSQETEPKGGEVVPLSQVTSPEKEKLLPPDPEEVAKRPADLEAAHRADAEERAKEVAKVDPELEAKSRVTSTEPELLLPPDPEETAKLEAELEARHRAAAEEKAGGSDRDEGEEEGEADGDVEEDEDDSEEREQPGGKVQPLPKVTSPEEEKLLPPYPEEVAKLQKELEAKHKAASAKKFRDPTGSPTETKSGARARNQFTVVVAAIVLSGLFLR